MAGITDLPFRRIVARFGAGLVVSEMVASGEMLTAKPSVRAKARTELGLDLPCSVQLAGREAAPMGEAAKIVADMGARIIDINMGCPAKKVTGGYSGAALMRDPDHALRLIAAEGQEPVKSAPLQVIVNKKVVTITTVAGKSKIYGAADTANLGQTATGAVICTHF